MTDAWPEPIPLPQTAQSVAEFNLGWLPPSIGRWAQDITSRMQCPADYVGITILVGLGAVIGRQVVIRPQEHSDWEVTPNIWGLLIGRPGTLKTPAMQAALSPLFFLEQQAENRFKQQITEYNSKTKIAKIKDEEVEKRIRKTLSQNLAANLDPALLRTEEQELESPLLRRYIASNSTTEALGELLRQNPNGVLVYRDELVSLLRSLDRDENAEARGLYLTGWNGDSSYKFDRIGRGLNLRIPSVCISMLGSTQPSCAEEYMSTAIRGGSGDDGLIQRFGMLVWPNSNAPWIEVDREPDLIARKSALEVYRRLDELEYASIEAKRDESSADEPEGGYYLRFDYGGLGLFREWRGDLERRIRSGELAPALESHLAKYRSLVPSLALILHLAGGGKGNVTEMATRTSLRLVEYLESHARRAYSHASTAELIAAHAIISKIRGHQLPFSFRSWEVWRPGWSQLTDREVVMKALKLLVDLRWLRIDREETGGRAATIFRVNSRYFE